MKRTVLVLLAAAMVVAALPLCAFADTASPGGIIFTMTDYRLNGHTADNLPFFEKGVLYVPAFIFADLGVTEVVVPNVYLSLASLDANRILFYNIKSGLFSDESGEEHRLKPINRGDVWFYPAFLAADHFALTCEYYSEAGPVPFLRVARGDTDNAHLEAALSAYGVAAAALARENLGVSLDATNSGKLTPSGKNYRPAIVINGLANASAVAGALAKSTGATAVFCVSAQEATENVGACLRLSAAGYGFVLRGEGLDEEAIAAGLEALNGVLRAAACGLCRTVFFFSEPTGAIKQAVSDLGCVSAWPDMDFTGEAAESGTLISDAADTLAGAVGRKTVLLLDGQSAGALPGLIGGFDAHGCSYVTLSDVLTR